MLKTTNFTEWANVWLENYKKFSVKETTYNETYKRTVDLYLAPYFGDTLLSEITSLEIRSFLNKQSERFSESTMKKMRLCLNGIFDAAIENNICEKNPAKNIKVVSQLAPREKRTYSQSQVDDILQYADIHQNGLYIRILLDLGLRCSELCGLQWTDIDFDKRIVNIRRGCTASKGKALIGNTKNRSSFRTLPLNSILCNMLKNYHRASIYVVPSQRKKNSPITPSTFTKVFYKPFFIDYCKSDYLSPHELRHTCGTLLYEKTHDIYAVSKFLGHSSISITSKLYVHDNAELLRKALHIE